MKLEGNKDNRSRKKWVGSSEVKKRYVQNEPAKLLIKANSFIKSLSICFNAWEKQGM